jgi:hypothetical protein
MSYHTRGYAILYYNEKQERGCWQMRFLILGDIVGRPGRNAVKDYLKNLQVEFDIDFTIANGENASSGLGITEKNAIDISECGVDVITTGNHVWDKKETEMYIDNYDWIIRPANYPEPCPGKGYVIKEKNGIKVAVINTSGLVYLKALDCPFKKIDEILSNIPSDVNIKILDFHAEATAEKISMGYYCSKRISLIFGTHTHVQTADSRIIDDYTGYITDVGMTGPLNGVIGVKKEIILRGFLSKRPGKYEIATGTVQINALVADIDESGKCKELFNFIRIYD